VKLHILQTYCSACQDSKAYSSAALKSAALKSAALLSEGLISPYTFNTVLSLSFWTLVQMGEALVNAQIERAEGKGGIWDSAIVNGN
jgi:hypothetical protein